MRAPRWMVMGVAVAGVSSALWIAAVPDINTNNPEHATKQQLSERRWVYEHRDQELRAKLRGGVAGDLADRARSSEVRRAADDVVKQLLREAP